MRCIKLFKVVHEINWCLFIFILLTPPSWDVDVSSSGATVSFDCVLHNTNDFSSVSGTMWDAPVSILMERHVLSTTYYVTQMICCLLSSGWVWDAPVFINIATVSFDCVLRNTNDFSSVPGTMWDAPVSILMERHVLSTTYYVTQMICCLLSSGWVWDAPVSINIATVSFDCVLRNTNDLPSWLYDWCDNKEYLLYLP